MNWIEDTQPKQQASVTTGGHLFHMRLLNSGNLGDSWNFYRNKSEFVALEEPLKQLKILKSQGIWALPVLIKRKGSFLIFKVNQASNKL